jgi:hypothetical protein
MKEGKIMKNAGIFSVIMILVFMVISVKAQANLVSTFDNNSEGWTGDDPTNHDWNLVSWQSTGGNPGGFVLGSESSPVGGVGYFIAPGSWNGDWTPYIGGTLKYDI